MKDYYDILEINETASTEVIKAAYKALVKKYHPDNCSNGDSGSSDRLAEINEAYEVLSDETKRMDYDIKYKQISNRGVRQKESSAWSEGDNLNQSDSQNTVKERKGIFATLLKSLGEEMLNTLAENQNIFNEAYSKGCEMDDMFLIKRFKSSTGVRKNGYAKAMEERGILRRDEAGKLLPTYSYRSYFF